MATETKKTAFNWDLNEITASLAKTMEYASQDPLKVYEHQYGTLDSYIKKMEKIKESLKADILQEFEKRFNHQGYTYTNEETGGTLQRVIQVRTDVDSNKAKKILFLGYSVKYITNPIWFSLLLVRNNRHLFLNLSSF